MKKILCGILAAAMAVSCAACSSGKDYSEYDTAVLEVASVSAKAGDTVDVEVLLNNNPGTATIGVELEYDASVLTAISAEASGALKGKGFFSSNASEDEIELFEDSEGAQLSALWFDANNFDGNGEIMTITFQVAEDAEAGDYTIKFVESEDDLVSVTETGPEIDDVKYTNVEVTYLEGAVTVS